MIICTLFLLLMTGTGLEATAEPELVAACREEPAGGDGGAVTICCELREVQVT
jgi:hypothetical protein